MSSKFRIPRGRFKTPPPGADLRIGALESGSDFSVFIDHLGIASLNVAYGGDDDGGIYDDFYWYTHFPDTTFIAQTNGTFVLQRAQADILPYDFAALGETLHL